MFRMPVEMVVQKRPPLMGECGVTVFTRSASFGHRECEASAGDFMVSRLVTIMTLKTETPHMDVAAARVKIEKGIEFPVLNRILTGTSKMAGAAGLAAGFSDVLGHIHQIHLRLWHTRPSGCFSVGFGCVVADEAVDPGFFRKIKCVVLPTIPGMAGGATGPVAGDVYEEVIHRFGGLA